MERGAAIRLEIIVSGFISSGIFPPNFTLLMKNMNVYQGGRLPKKP